MRPPCIVPACDRPSTDALGMCGRCWRLVSVELRLAIHDHHDVAFWRRPLSGLEAFLNRPADGAGFLAWSWRQTIALAAWEAAVERSERRNPAYEPWSALRPASEAVLSNISRKMP